MTNRTTRRRWAIINPETGRYVVGRDGESIANTYDADHAREVAGPGDVVVDADWLAVNWPIVKRTKAIPPEARPEGPPCD